MLDSLFNPKGVAVIGASSKKLHIGNRIIKNLLDFGYNGAIYPINPKADKIRGVRAYKSILNVPGQVDVAHIVIPAKFVPEAVEDCGKKGVKNVIINSGGFSEIGTAGAAIQTDFMRKANKYGIRILGPNCQGIINSDKDVKAYCNFTFTFPEPGNISIVALSGGVAEVLHQRFVSSGIGTRMYASSGNACDISIPEFIRYLGDDSETRVIVTYVEGLKEPEEFMKAVKEVAIKKPILAMKAGRTAAGAKAAASHTGGLVGEDMATDLIFSKTGVMDFSNEGRMVDAAIVLASQPVPRGNRVGIITNTGGPAVIATDVLAKAGFTLPELSKKTTEILKAKLHKEASISNPIDVLATGTDEHYKHCLDAMLTDENIDSIFISFVTPFFVNTEKIAMQIARANDKRIKPIVCNLMTDLKKWTETEKILKRGGVPCFDLPSDAAHALGALNRYRHIVNTDSGHVTRYDDVNYDTVSEILSLAETNKQDYLLADQVYTILDAYGIKVPMWHVANDIKGAVKAASDIGYPVVVKADAASVVHKSDVGGVVLNLNSEDRVREALDAMVRNVGASELRFFVQKYISGGLELIFGARAEPGLGHTIVFGLGGIFVEVLKDVVFCLTPVTDVEAANMIKSIKGAEMISGARGGKGVNIDSLIELIQRLSQLVTDFTQIQELDFNPVVAFDNKIVVLDARIILRL